MLICAGLGKEWHDKENIDAKKQDQLNDLLLKIWNTLKSTILKEDNGGYKIDFIEKTCFELAGKEILCPVSKRLLDKNFRGYTPWIKGNLTFENLENYYINQNIEIQFPLIFGEPYYQPEFFDPRYNSGNNPKNNSYASGFCNCSLPSRNITY